MKLIHTAMLTLGAMLILATGAYAQDEPGAEPALTPEQLEQVAHLREVLESLDPQTGDIELQDGLATLHVPDDFYYLDAGDAESVLVDLWGNPPGQEVLGMLLPANMSPLDEASWAVTIDYTEEGYVSDEDAADIDYDDLLGDMKNDTRNSNKARVDAGYPEVQLLGWAEPPHYDPASKKLYWAKELRFGDADDTTLNYDIRALGRRGTLELRFIGAMSQLDEINASRDSVLAMTEFNEGHRYMDFDPDIDEVAAYGIGALIAGKLAAKAGFLAGGLLLLKKLGVFILMGIAALWRKISGLFRTNTLGPN